MGASFPPPAFGAAARDLLNLPINGVSVTDKAYGAVDDGLNGYFFATWVAAGTAFSAYSSNVSVTVANTGPNGVGVLTVPGATSGNASSPLQSWAGKPIAIAGAGAAGGVLVAMVTSVYYIYGSPNVIAVQLSIPAPTPLTASVQQIMCPCFVSGSDGTGLPSCVGKKLWIGSGGSVPQGGAGSSTVPGSQLQFTPTTVLITGYTSPFQITTSAIPGVSQTAKAGTYIEWGTDNSPAVIAAGLAALAAGHDILYFSGQQQPNSMGRFCLFDWETNSGGATPADQTAGTVASALHWYTSDASMFLTPMTQSQGNQSSDLFQQNQLYKAAVPWNAAGPPPPKVSIDAAVHWPRLATLTQIVVLVVGDSWANGDPSGQGNAVWGPFASNLVKRNPGKQFYFVNTGINGLTWNGLLQTLAANATVTVDGLGTVVPDLVCLFVTGGNDASAISRNDVMSCVNMVRGWGNKNGYPPDICMQNGAALRSMEKPSANSDAREIVGEYSGVFLRSLARVRNIALLDLGRHMALSMRGWSEDALATKLVPPVASANAGPSVPYVVPYQCRDFFMAIQLGAGAASTFWSTVGTLSIALSPKPDNRLVISVDGSNNLTVTAVTWGLTVPTTCTMANGSASLVTSGQVSVAVSGNVSPIAPAYSMGVGNNVLGMIGQCYLAAGAYYGNEDYRSYIMGFINAGIAFGADGAVSAVTSGFAASAEWYGGQMFTAQDATAQVDCIVAGAGAVAHPLTGANSLVTTVSAYTNFQGATLAAVNSQGNLTASSQKVFVGSISVKPTYNKAVASGADAGAGAVITVRKSGTHVKVGYIAGGTALTDIRSAIQSNEQLWWEGEVECYGGPFVPKIYAGATAAVQVLYCQIDDREANYRKPVMTLRQAFGGFDANYTSNPFGGDTGHPSQIAISTMIDEVSAAQNLAIPNRFAANFGTNTPTTGFSYAIPANQAFTELTPAGTLATGTVTLPSVFPQGERLEIFSTQAISALTITAPGGLSIVGAAVTALAANTALAYRLVGTSFCRVA